MAGDTIITLVGNLVDDPANCVSQAAACRCQLPGGVHPARSTVRRTEWKDGETLFMSCSVWQYAENVAESLTEGTRVIVSGRLKQRALPRPRRASVAPSWSSRSTRSIRAPQRDRQGQPHLP